MWKPHFFVLSHDRIVYSEVNTQDETDEDEDAATPSQASQASSASHHNGLHHCRSGCSVTTMGGVGEQSELHFSEAWFHGNLERGRETAEKLLLDNAHLGDGTFIVRKSQTFIGDYSLSFLRKGQVRKKTYLVLV
jgi:phosphatidylinositol phospholipase C gamma-1